MSFVTILPRYRWNVKRTSAADQPVKMCPKFLFLVIVYGVLHVSYAAESQNAPPPPEIYRKLSGLDINKLSKEIYEQELERELKETLSESQDLDVSRVSLPSGNRNHLTVTNLVRSNQDFNRENSGNGEYQERQLQQSDDHHKDVWGEALKKAKTATILADCDSNPMMCKKIVYYLVLQKALQEMEQ